MIQITKEGWEEWKESNEWLLFQKYLIDSAKEEIELLTDTISEGGIIEEKDQVKIATINLTLKRIAQISLEEIEEFYKEERK